MKFKSVFTNLQLTIRNFKLTSQTSRLWPLFAALAILALLVTYLATQPFAVKVVSTNPNDQAKDIPVDSTIIINFDRQLSTGQQSALEVVTQPPINGTISFESTGSKGTWTHGELFAGDTQYTVFITGQNLRDYTFTFHTRPRPSLIDLLNMSQNQGPVNPTDPKQRLLQTLPYFGDNFHVQHTALGDNIYITLYEQPLDETKIQALTWIKKFGFTDPEKELKIRYNIPKYLDTEYLQNLAP